MSRTSEAVFYFDVLGFSARAAGEADSAVDALSALAPVLGTPALAALTGQWQHRYAFSDSVFLTTGDPLDAIKQAASLVFSLAHFTATDDEPVLVRGGIAHGPVQHLKGLFLTSREAANVVGDGVVAAVRLEQAGLKGPPVLLSASLVETLRTRDAGLVEWLLAPTSTPEVWEILWPLPEHPSLLEREALSIEDVCRLAVRLFERVLSAGVRRRRPRRGRSGRGQRRGARVGLQVNAPGRRTQAGDAAACWAASAASVSR